MLNKSEREFMRAMGNADNFEEYFEGDNADAPVISTSKGVGAALTPQKGNPRFTAQFDLAIDVFYLDGAAAFAPIAPAALDPSLQTALAFPIFGNSDYAGGYKLFLERYPVNTWAFNNAASGIIGPNGPGVNNYPSYVQNGDLLLVWRATVGAVDAYALVRIRAKNVAYGTLLAAISSDRFVVNNIRYGIADSTKVAQYENQIGLLRQSLFGRVNNDYVSPASFKKPEQFQTNVVDVPLVKGIDKETLLASYVNYDCTSITWSVFVMTSRKLEA